MNHYLTSLSIIAKTNTNHSVSKFYLMALMMILWGVASVCAQTTTWVSKDSDGNEGNSYSYNSSVSASGRFVAFISVSDTLVPYDTNGQQDIFVHDLYTSETTRVSVDSKGMEANGNSAQPAISADGRYVAFESNSSNLVSDDTNARKDVFVHDRASGKTIRVSINSDGKEGNEDSAEPSISADGRYVVFTTFSDNLVPDDSNGRHDIFVHDMETGETTRVSVNTDGDEANNTSFFSSISTDGRYVAFDSYATNLVPDDTNESWDVFVYDRETGETNRISVDSAGNQANDWSRCQTISAIGRYVTFNSNASNLVQDDSNGVTDIFVHDREIGETNRVSVSSEGNEANSPSFTASISPNGRYVAYDSSASNLVPNDMNGLNDVFMHNRVMGKTIRISVDSEGNDANGVSRTPAISAEGHVAFTSMATNLVPEDTYSNYWGSEIYVHGPITGEPLEVIIDIAPRSDPNRVRPERGRPAVAILTEEAFDATQVDPESVRFGPDEAEPLGHRVLDVDNDRDADLVFYFLTEETGIACGDTEATLTGETFEEVQITGTDTIITMGCRQFMDD